MQSNRFSPPVSIQFEFFFPVPTPQLCLSSCLPNTCLLIVFHGLSNGGGDDCLAVSCGPLPISFSGSWSDTCAPALSYPQSCELVCATGHDITSVTKVITCNSDRSYTPTPVCTGKAALCGMPFCQYFDKG